MESFTLKRTKFHQCLTVQENKKNEIVVRNCSTASLSLNMRWIWVNRTGNVHLMNVMTLQCLEFLTKGTREENVCTTRKTNYIGEVAMNQCKKTDGQFLKVTRGSNSIYSELCKNDRGVGARNYYLALRKRQSAYQAQSKRNDASWKWENEGTNLHRRNSTYKGW